MTRIPVGKAGSGDPKLLAASTQYFPLVGVVVGSGAGLIYWLTQHLWSNSIAVVLSIIGAVLLTGGFHEDGLADVADSAGAWTPEKKLEIMRDSRIGTYGGLALILSLMLSMATLLDISNSADKTNHATGMVITTLILAHVLGRWSSLALIFSTEYARDAAANKVFVDGVNRQRMIFGSLITLFIVVVCYTMLSISAIIALIITLVCVFLSRLWFTKNIGGITGDCLGAANKLVEICVYLGVAATLYL